MLRTAGRILIGVILIISGIAKLLDLNATLQSIGTYINIPTSMWMQKFLLSLVSLAEIVIGSIMLKNNRTINAYKYALILVSFFAGISIGRFVMQIEGSCGCFGMLQFFSSLRNALIRDGAMLIIVGGLILFDDNGVNRNKIILLGVLPAILLGNLSMTVLNGYFSGRHIISSWQGNTSPTWYGIGSDRIAGERVTTLLTNVYGPTTRTVPINDNSILQEVYSMDAESAADEFIGWAVSVILPYPLMINTPRIEYFELFTVIAPDLSISHLQVVKPFRRVSIGWPNQHELGRLIADLKQQNGMGFNSIMKFPSQYDINEKLTAAIISVINNIKYNILYSTSNRLLKLCIK